MESGEETNSNPSSILDTANSFQLSGSDVDLNGFNVAHKIRTAKQCVKGSNTGDSDYTNDTVNLGELNSCRYEKTDEMDNMTTGICHISENKSQHSPSKIRKNTTGSGVLRYALHLRFLCPFPKKSSRSVQRCKADPSSGEVRNNLNTEGERRFYLYNDLRVVFPQRQTDSDEGKVYYLQHFTYTIYVYIQFSCFLSIKKKNPVASFVCLIFNLLVISSCASGIQLLTPMNVHMLQLHVEYHFPSDPKYFDISN